MFLRFLIPPHDTPAHDWPPRSFQFCDPKTEVEIVGTDRLSRDKKIEKNSERWPKPCAGVSIEMFQLVDGSVHGNGTRPRQRALGE
jgi:hypothetical protein